MAKTFSDPRSPLYWDTIGGCCLTPPVGHHLPHISGTVGKIQGQRRYSWAKSVHKGRWNEDWCRGGTRAGPRDHVRKQPRLMSMPTPNETPVFAGRPLDFPLDHDELVWRTRMEPGLAELVFPGSTGANPLPAGALSLAGRIEKLAKYWLNLDLRKLNNRKGGAANRALRRQMIFMSHLRVDPVAPADDLQHTPALQGGFYDCDYKAPPAVGAVDYHEHHCSHMFRMYPLPVDPQAILAYTISMIEGRAGRTLDDSISAEWKDKVGVNAALEEARKVTKLWKKFPHGWGGK